MVSLRLGLGMHLRIATRIVCLLNLFPWWNISNAVSHRPMVLVSQGPPELLR